MGRDLQVSQLPALLEELKNWYVISGYCRKITDSLSQVPSDSGGYRSSGQEDRHGDRRGKVH